MTKLSPPSAILADLLTTLRASQSAALDYVRRRQGVLVGHNHVVRTGGGMYYLPDGCHLQGAQRDARGRSLEIGRAHV